MTFHRAINFLHIFLQELIMSQAIQPFYPFGDKSTYKAFHPHLYATEVGKVTYVHRIKTSIFGCKLHLNARIRNLLCQSFCVFEP